MPKRLDKKAIERAYLIKAQCVGSLIPPGIFEEGEAPDFRLKIDSGLIGIELAEVMRGAVDSKFPPVEVEKFHNEVMGQAKATYFRDSNLVPAAVNLYFNPIIGNSKKDDLASLIVILVRQNIHRAKPTVNLTAMSFRLKY